MCKLHNRYTDSSKRLVNGLPNFLLHCYGFVQSHADNSLFVRNRGDVFFLALLVYVDDIVIATNNEKEATDFKTLLNSNFCLKDLGDLRYFLGIEVACSKRYLYLSKTLCLTIGY